MVSLGAPISMKSLKLTLEKTIKGGTRFPAAFAAAIKVRRALRSAEVTLPTCFWPFAATIFDGVCKVVKACSSTL